jgi:hypothetical protein
MESCIDEEKEGNAVDWNGFTCIGEVTPVSVKLYLCRLNYICVGEIGEGVTGQ